MLKAGAERDAKGFLGVVRYRVLSDDRVFKKKCVALEPMGLNDSMARGTKWGVVESSTYLTSFLVAASSAAPTAVIDVDDK